MKQAAGGSEILQEECAGMPVGSTPQTPHSPETEIVLIHHVYNLLPSMQ